MPDLGDIPVLARGAIPGAADSGPGGASVGADPGPAPGLVWLEDGLEVDVYKRQAYNNARLICRPESSWIKRD